ncbi:MAG: NapC/NirT family cytochrome c [Pseudomonadota bacterium]
MNEKQPGFLSRIWTTLRRPSAKYSLLTLLVVGGFGGIVFWGGFNTAVHMTNSLEFCISCHEMRDTVYKEYKETVHYQNKFGVRATCPDCHVPREWTHMMVRKAKASFELWAKFTGKVSTPEKFEKHRMELATSEWARMKDAGSRECRNCHSWEAMETAKQKPAAQKKHAMAQATGKTCVDCHKGIAHLLPAEYVEPEEE